ncbi:hypothetical protein LEP1GSC161_2931 [Leptospira santarosai str. CBC1416]|uniref:Uncharacterized protein n=1 Tax=Leptospira santarosai str. CBC1416 TaxID=1193059 RepID=M6VW47_9LEPT|nr:hypothetical protein LEP1GSC161_2931 [Leptospira santarosai str. CBC1416]
MIKIYLIFLVESIFGGIIQKILLKIDFRFQNILIKIEFA